MDAELNLLLIEDDPAEARLLTERLAETPGLGYRMTHAERLGTGLRTLGEGRFDAVLLDLSLPDGNTFEALDRLRAHSPQIPVLVLTVLEDEDLALSAVQAGAQDTLVKSEMTGRSLGRSLRYAIERQRILAKLEQLDRLKSEFVSAASHEMRTPLAIIREFVSLVRDEVTGPVNAEQRDCLESAVRNCDRLGELLGDLLELGKIESGRMNLERRRTDVAVLVAECSDGLLPRCRVKRQSLHLDLQPDLPVALCDESKIRQVVASLLGNAHKFTPEGGSLEIKVRSDGAMVEVVISDDGPGIREADRALVFDSFVQIDREDGPGARGTGLGLSIAKGIVDLHGGSIGLTSEVGRGSEVTFAIPVHSDLAELRAAVEDHIRASVSTATRGCLMLIRRADLVTGRAGNDEIRAEIDTIRATAVAVLRPGDRTLVLRSEGLLAVLMDTDRDGCARALSRLARELARAEVDPASLEVSITDLDSEPSADRLLDAARSDLAPFEVDRRPPEPKRVLVIDDEEMMVEFVTRSLDSSGLALTTRAAGSGYEGCIRFGEFLPDLVILDINMEGIDGVEVLRSIRSAGSRKETRVLVATGATTRVGEMVALGCDDYICKPFRISELLDKVTTLLDIEDGSELCRAC